MSDYTYTEIRNIDVMVGNKFHCDLGCCSAEILAVFSATDGTNYVAYENEAGAVRRMKVGRLKDEYRIRNEAKHSLKQGDLFVINDEKGKAVDNMTFLYMSDKHVVRLGASSSRWLSVQVSNADLKFYLDKFGGGQYSRIEKVSDMNEHEIAVTTKRS